MQTCDLPTPKPAFAEATAGRPASAASAGKRVETAANAPAAAPTRTNSRLVGIGTRYTDRA